MVVSQTRGSGRSSPVSPGSIKKEQTTKLGEAQMQDIAQAGESLPLRLANTKIATSLRGCAKENSPKRQTEYSQAFTAPFPKPEASSPRSRGLTKSNTFSGKGIWDRAAKSSTSPRSPRASSQARQDSSRPTSPRGRDPLIANQIVDCDVTDSEDCVPDVPLLQAAPKSSSRTKLLEEVQVENASQCGDEQCPYWLMDQNELKDGSVNVNGSSRSADGADVQYVPETKGKEQGGLLKLKTLTYACGEKEEKVHQPSARVRQILQAGLTGVERQAQKAAQLLNTEDASLLASRSELKSLVKSMRTAYLGLAEQFHASEEGDGTACGNTKVLAEVQSPLLQEGDQRGALPLSSLALPAEDDISGVAWRLGLGAVSARNSPSSSVTAEMVPLIKALELPASRDRTAGAKSSADRAAEEMEALREEAKVLREEVQDLAFQKKEAIRHLAISLDRVTRERREIARTLGKVVAENLALKAQLAELLRDVCHVPAESEWGEVIAEALLYDKEAVRKAGCGEGKRSVVPSFSRDVIQESLCQSRGGFTFTGSEIEEVGESSARPRVLEVQELQQEIATLQKALAAAARS